MECLLFNSGIYGKLIVDANKEIYLGTQQTNFQLRSATELKLGKHNSIYDSPEEEEHFLSLPTEKFEKAVIKAFQGKGYRVIRRNDRPARPS